MSQLRLRSVVSALNINGIICKLVSTTRLAAERMGTTKHIRLMISWSINSISMYEYIHMPLRLYDGEPTSEQILYILQNDATRCFTRSFLVANGKQFDFKIEVSIWRDDTTFFMKTGRESV